MSVNPIGLFDSGVGGTSIFSAIHGLLPNESSIYLADSHHAPYGIKTAQEIINLSVKNTEYLLEKGSKLIVVACNTATTNAIDYLRQHYSTPFIGIEPAIKPAAFRTKTNAIGILATQGTLSSALFSKTSQRFASHITVVEQMGTGLVPIIERGELDSEELKKLLKQYLAPMIAARIDHLVLGCTHYSYLVPMLRTLLPKGVQIIDTGAAVANQVKAVLSAHDLLNTQTAQPPTLQFFSNGNPEVITTLLGSAFSVKYSDF